MLENIFTWQSSLDPLPLAGPHAPPPDILDDEGGAVLQPQEVAGGRGRGRGRHAVGLGRGEHRVSLWSVLVKVIYLKLSWGSVFISVLGRVSACRGWRSSTEVSRPRKPGHGSAPHRPQLRAALWLVERWQGGLWLAETAARRGWSHEDDYQGLGAGLVSRLHNHPHHCYHLHHQDSGHQDHHNYVIMGAVPPITGDQPLAGLQTPATAQTNTLHVKELSNCGI